MFLMEYARFRAVENMVIDLNMLDNWSLPDSARLRFYGWQCESFTCGRFQTGIAADFGLPRTVKITRRPTGGGLVRHGVCDLTYALVLPKTSALCKMPARESYRVVHEAIAETFCALGICASINRDENPHDPKTSKCFENPSYYDVVCESDKLAGAAQKRDKFGILFQGEIDMSRLLWASDKESCDSIIRTEFAKKLAVKFTKICGEEIENIYLPKFLRKGI